MGTFTQEVENGLRCSSCGVWLPDVFGEVNSNILRSPPGIERICDSCQNDLNIYKYKSIIENRRRI